MPMIGGGPLLPLAVVSVFMIVVRLAWTCGKTFSRHATIWLMVGSTTHGLRSFAPMSMVTSWTLPLWRARNAGAWASWLPAEEVQMPPLIMVPVVSPAQPSLTHFSLGVARSS